MATSSPISWSELFQTEGRQDFHLQFLTIRKAGQPFLLLPHPRSLAARALSLYPAQTSKAQLAKKALYLALRVGIPLPLEKASIGISSGDPFVSFLKDLAGDKTGTPPLFAILAGNPNAEGRRFILLLFNDRRQPAVVVKAGIGETAKQLIRRERSFLQSVPSGIAGLPAFRSPFNSAKVEAVALGYIEGSSPQGEDRSRIGNILSSWIAREKQVSIENVPAWRVLREKAASHPLFARLSNALAGMTFHPALFHGDFAPWNIKVSCKDGTWSVLDWERGELIGFPTWDWFHYVIQTGILVRKLTTRDLVQCLEGLLVAPEFRTYLRLSGLEGSEKILAIAYLFYCVEVLQQTEGRQRATEFLASLVGQWLA
jgi:hypothetical protein